MEPEPIIHQPFVQERYDYATNMLMYGGKNAMEVKTGLLERGVDEQTADSVIAEVEVLIRTARKKKSQKNMLYGALWCIGGIALTVAHVGLIFWGAIIFGGLQFFRGFSGTNA